MLYCSVRTDSNRNTDDAVSNMLSVLLAIPRNHDDAIRDRHAERTVLILPKSHDTIDAHRTGTRLVPRLQLIFDSRRLGHFGLTANMYSTSDNLSTALEGYSLTLEQYSTKVRKYYENKGVKNVTVRILEDIPVITHDCDGCDITDYFTRDVTVPGPVNIYFLTACYPNMRTDMYNALMLCSEFDIESITFILLDTDRTAFSNDRLACGKVNVEYQIFKECLKACPDVRRKIKACTRMFRIRRSSYVNHMLPLMAEKSELVMFSWRGMTVIDEVDLEYGTGHAVTDDQYDSNSDEYYDYFTDSNVCASH